MMRASQKPKTSAPKRGHGSSSWGSDADGEAKPQFTRVFADVPATVPELPGAYLVRDEDLAQLKAALLTEGSASGTALTSKTQQSKVGAHGMVRSQCVLRAGLMCEWAFQHELNNAIDYHLACLNRAAWERPPSLQHW